MSDFSTRTTESGVVVVQPTGRLNMVAAPRYENSSMTSLMVA